MLSRGVDVGEGRPKAFTIACTQHLILSERHAMPHLVLCEGFVPKSAGLSTTPAMRVALDDA